MSKPGWRVTLTCLIAPCFIFLLASTTQAEPATAAVPAVVEKWVTKAAKVKTAQASFTQNRFLRSVHKPLVTTGNISYAAPASIFMQSGEPPKMLATLAPDGSLTVQSPQKKTAEVYTPAALEELAGGQGIALLQGGFPKSVADWQAKFTLQDTEPLENGTTRVTTKLAGKANPVIFKIEFYIQTESGDLKAIHFHFRDGSRIENVFNEIKENAPVAASVFVPDLTGYEVKNH